jgi:glycosyltransferase involved in cell wall biosynthesis
LKKEKKILILPSWYPPDGGGFFKDHAEALNHGDIKVDVLVNRIMGLSSHSINQIIESRRITEKIEGPLKVIRSAYLKWPKLEKVNVRGWVKRYLELYEYYTEKYGEPDLIIAHSTIWAGYVASLIKEEHKIPYIVIEHRSRFARDIEATQKMIREWYFPYIRNSLTYASRIITVSEAIDAQLISISPGIRNKISTIPNLIDTDFFSLPKKGRSKQPFIFLAFGILEHVKGFDILIEAFAGFVASHDGEFFLRIGGRGGNYGKLRRLAKKFGVEDRVTLHGYVPREEVNKEMQQANLFILPSRFEAFGVVLIEAMATGCPVISTYSGGPEYIVKEHSGILVEPEDPAGLEKAMEQVYENYSSYDPEKIRQEVVDLYSVAVIRERYHAVIKEILNEKNLSSDS